MPKENGCLGKEKLGNQGETKPGHPRKTGGPRELLLKEYRRTKWITTRKTETTAGDAEGPVTEPTTAFPSRRYKGCHCHQRHGKQQLWPPRLPQTHPPGKGHEKTWPKASQHPSTRKWPRSKKWSRTYYSGPAQRNRIFKRLCPDARQSRIPSMWLLQKKTRRPRHGSS